MSKRFWQKDQTASTCRVLCLLRNVTIESKSISSREKRKRVIEGSAGWLARNIDTSGWYASCANCSSTGASRMGKDVTACVNLKRSERNRGRSSISSFGEGALRLPPIHSRCSRFGQRFKIEITRGVTKAALMYRRASDAKFQESNERVSHG